MTNNTVALWRTLRPTTDFRYDFDRLFSDWLAPVYTKEEHSEVAFAPACDVKEKEGHYLINFEMPGVKKDDIRLEIVDNQIVLSGERRDETKRKEDQYLYSERRFGKFQRAFTLPKDVDLAQIEASYQDGILHILIPKAEAAKPRQIKISSGAGPSKFFNKFLNPAKEKEEEHLLESQKEAS